MKIKWIWWLAIMGLHSWGAADAQETAGPLTPRIVCPEPVFNFGERDNSGMVEHEFRIRNEGTLSLEILNVHASCGCTAVRPSQNVIAPGGEAVIHAKLDLRGRTGYQQKTISVQSNDPQTPTLMLQMVGTAVQGLRVQPSLLFFGRVDPQSSRTRTFEIVSSRGPFNVESYRTDNPGLRLAPVELSPGEDGSVRRFELTLAPDLPEGNVAGAAYVKTDLPDQPELMVTVAAYILNAPQP